TVVRPERALLGFARVTLPPGDAVDVTFTVAADRLAITDRTGKRVVDPGMVSLMIAASAADVRTAVDVPVTGDRRAVGADRALTTPAAVAYAHAD
ncbi:MAG: fibronectin type III-like domain-contianing protein, partial [Actinomycetia bacterium]|nr:fibronectin type III-like domain-contianing protein [Actinomycetes bacterium]